MGALTFSFTENNIVGQVNQSENNLVQDILSGVKTMPFNNRQAMAYLQDQDADLLKVKEYLKTTKRPTVRNTRENQIKRYLKGQNEITIAKDGVLVSRKRDKRFHSRELVVVPDGVSMGLLYGLHLNLNHPSAFQLTKVVDTKFFILDRESKIKKLVADCTLCQSVAKIPEEIHSFKANKMPDHPGQAFTVDILRMAKKNIVVAVENFSGFVSAVFANSEKQDDLLDGIISAVTPFQSLSLAQVRVDQAPAFKAIFKKQAELRDLHIELELGECKNKNALALVDRKMQEIELEIKKYAPNKNRINVKILAKAVSVVNEKIRHQGLSAKEIMFSRDQYTQENLDISDEKIAEEKMNIRDRENIYSAKSKAAVPDHAKPAGASKGHLVFLKKDGAKLERRDLYLVINASAEEVSICKLPAALSGDTTIQFQPHNIRYRVKQTDIFIAPNQPALVEEHHEVPTSDDNTGYAPDTIREEDILELPTKLKYTAKTRVYPFEEDPLDDVFDTILDEDRSEEENGYIANNDQDDEMETGNASADRSDDGDDEEDSSSSDESYNVNNAEADDEEDSSSSDESDNINTIEGDDAEDNSSIDEPANALAAGTIDEPAQENQLSSDTEVEDNPLDGHNAEADSSDLTDDLNSNPVVLPNVGSRIKFRDPASNNIVKATVTRMHRTMQYQWPGWRNIRVDGEPRQSSVNLDHGSHGCVVWKYLHGAPRVPRVPVEAYVIPQTDGNYTLPAGPAYRDYDESFASSELGSGSDAEVLADRPRVYFVAPTAPYQDYLNQQVHFRQVPRRSRWQRFLDLFRPTN